MNDVVWRELSVLRSQLGKLVRTIEFLLDGLDKDPRFARLQSTRNMSSQRDWVKEQKKTGPEGLTGLPPSVPSWDLLGSEED